MPHAKVTMTVERDSGGGKEDHVSGSERSNSWRGTPGEGRGSRVAVRSRQGGRGCVWRGCVWRGCVSSRVIEGEAGVRDGVTEEMAEERGVRGLTWQLDGLEVRVLGLGGGARTVRDADVLALVY